MHWVFAVLGGLMIGAASSLLLITHGRIAGVSGIVGRIVQRGTSDRDWRIAFVAGLAFAGIVAALVAPTAIGAQVHSLPVLIAAGLAVGFGTQLANGCTSGHGVCGIARWSVRSLVAVATFMTTGAITVALVRGVS